MIEIKNIETIEDFKETADVQKSAWGFGDIEVESHHFMTRIRKYGGIIQGLYIDCELIGFTLAIIGRWQGEYFIYSHMSAIKKEHQGRGYGFLLKKSQGEEALKMGYNMIRWCFDPLQSQNAFFNIHRLGVVSREYERNVYGEGESGLLEGLPTDRLIAGWDLKSEKVIKRLREKVPVHIKEIPTENIGRFDRDVAYIEFPRDIRSLKKKDLNKAGEWRKKTGEQFQIAFKKGFTAEEIIFSKDNKRNFYKLYRF
ncbi:MAG: GNAT family N-acetyltransferase [Candidatus Aminicenantes bacterium]|nr:GNAT family N-acetyltransferase [Candidatus Aminicenantes bacterium]